MKSPTLSIGLPVYNGDQYLQAAIESLLSQTWTDLELIISDNGSDDTTPAIIQEFARRDQRVIVHCNDVNIGAAANYNLTVKLARGEFFAWANHDDLWAPTYFAKCLEALQALPQAVLAYSRATMVDDQGKPITDLLDDLNLDDDIPSVRWRRFQDLVRRRRDFGRKQASLWTTVYGVMRTETLRQTGMIGPYIASDTILIEELLMSGKFAEVDERLFFKRDHPDRSVCAQRSYPDRLAWFTGSASPKMIFPRSRLVWERAKAIWRVDLALRDKFFCSMQAARGHLLNREEIAGLTGEWWHNLRHLLAATREPIRLQDGL